LRQICFLAEYPKAEFGLMHDLKYAMTYIDNQYG
jgi:hypothetical protein